MFRAYCATVRHGHIEVELVVARLERNFNDCDKITGVCNLGRGENAVLLFDIEKAERFTGTCNYSRSIGFNPQYIKGGYA